MLRNPRTLRRALVTGALVAGSGLGAASVASATTGTASSSGTASTSAASGNGNGSTSTSTTPSAPPGAPANGSPPDPASASHGPGETLLTGADLQKATVAAEAAVPGATVVRAETDSSGASPYEVHMKKSDGTYVTVELDSSFGVVRTVSGFGQGPANSQGQGQGHGQSGAASAGNPPTTPSTA